MLIKRRTFLKLGSLASSSLMMPKFLKAFEHPGKWAGGQRVLVVLQLSGGNDGLNTVIPVRNDIYYKNRPVLGIPKNQALMLSDEAGLHPELSGLKKCYDAGNMAVLHNVGYPNPDRSHFRSMDIWQSASGSDELKNSGWIGRWLDAVSAGTEKPTRALEMDDTLSLALCGERMKGLALRDPRRLFESCQDPFFKRMLQAAQGRVAGDPQDYLYQVMAETVSGADYIFEQSKQRPTQSVYPELEIGRSLKTIASLICSDINTRVYYLSLGSFDTHVNQDARQRKLFSEMDAALQVFVSDLKASHRFEDVLLMTFSEFGRRVAQNASGGTDHGTANNMFFLSGGLQKAGLLNGLPDLSDLEAGDLSYRLDFRRVYATVMSKWLQADPEPVLGKGYEPMDFI